jgi:GxxExxY protein
MEADRNQNDPETYAIIGAAMRVHRELGHGFLKSVFQEAFARELTLCSIPFEQEEALPISYRGTLLDCCFQVDNVRILSHILVGGVWVGLDRTTRR